MQNDEMLNQSNETEEQEALNAIDAPEADGETEPDVKQPENTEPDPREAEIAELKAKLKQKDDRLALNNGHKKQLARLVKFMEQDGLIDEAEAAQKLGVSPEQYRGIVNGADVSDNPVEMQNKSFDELYVHAGVKAVLDEVYGDDTQKYVDAFATYGFQDPEVMQEYLATDKAKLPAFVVKHGKEFLQDIGEQKMSVRALAKELAKVRAENEALKSGKPASTQETALTAQRKTLPLSGVTKGTAATGMTSGSYAERLFG